MANFEVADSKKEGKSDSNRSLYSDYVNELKQDKSKYANDPQKNFDAMQKLISKGDLPQVMLYGTEHHLIDQHKPGSEAPNPPKKHSPGGGETPPKHHSGSGGDKHAPMSAAKIEQEAKANANSITSDFYKNSAGHAFDKYAHTITAFEHQDHNQADRQKFATELTDGLNKNDVLATMLTNAELNNKFEPAPTHPGEPTKPPVTTPGEPTKPPVTPPGEPTVPPVTTPGDPTTPPPTSDGSKIGLGDTSAPAWRNVKGLYDNPANSGVTPEGLTGLLGKDNYHVGLSVAEANARGFNYPIQTADGTNGTAHVNISIPDWSYPKGTTSVDVPIPAGGFTPATGSDGHLVVEDPKTGTYYDFWQLKQASDGSWSASSTAVSSMDSSTPRGSNAWGVSGAVGDVTAQELNSGVINHALALGVEQNWINKVLGDQGPGDNTDGDVAGAPLSENGKIGLKLPAGKTLADFDLTTAGKAIYGALLNYGGFIVGKGPNGNAFNAYTTGVSTSPDFGPGASELNQYLVYYQ